ncbi:MAG: LytTR family DNA-binding domain-containing protein [Clostridia bacterium]|jgi:DNA-binding LytR/AlgR family response regulator|nr:LytTR family DNA-binding domain-containing protein [Clostridia bacterium]MDD3094256.1 LytTR family DNA-binding domain-containing protein [Clostridia bacterium]
MLKVKLVASKEKYEEIEKELKALGIDIDDDSEFTLSEDNTFIDHLTGKLEDSFHRINIDDVIYIESLAHDVLVHTSEAIYRIKERLWQLENLLDPDKFIRISNSVIVSKKAIKSIKPALSQKFMLKLKNEKIVDVTRSYYYIFKDKLGI